MTDSYDPDEHARHDDPDTSAEAAEALTTFGKHCQLLLEAFGKLSDQPWWEGMTFEEAAVETGLEPWAVSKRVSDLRHLKLIAWIPVNLEGVHTYVTRRGSSNRKQRVYDITQLGRDVLARMAAMS